MELNWSHPINEATARNLIHEIHYAITDSKHLRAYALTILLARMAYRQIGRA